jgi:energy-converting hydrogenase B subunit D
MVALQAMVIALVGLSAAAVVLSRDVVRQALINGIYGLTLTVLFLVFQAPDVALSALVVGAVALPLVTVISIARVRAHSRK